MEHPKNLIEVGVFDRLTRAENAISGLLQAGVDRDRISVVCSRDLPELPQHVEQVDPSFHTATGATAGGVIGSLLGGFATVAGVAATGGTALLVAGTALGGAAAGGVAGGFIGAMASRAGDAALADHYEQALRDGQILIAVEDTDDASQPGLADVRHLLEVLGARTDELKSSG